MELYKIINEGDKVYIKTLVYNPKVWNGHQWSYMYVTDNYPEADIYNAKNFGMIENAWKWIKKHEPN